MQMESYVESGIIKRVISDPKNISVNDFINLAKLYIDPETPQEEEPYKLGLNDIKFLIELLDPTVAQSKKKLLQNMIDKFRKSPSEYKAYNKTDTFIIVFFFWVIRIDIKKILKDSKTVFSQRDLLTNKYKIVKFRPNTKETIKFFVERPDYYYCERTANGQFKKMYELPIVFKFF